jgi:adenosylhomocysteine nucleosidase
VTGTGFVTGILAEQRCLEAAFKQHTSTPPPRYYCAGASLERAYTGAQRLIEDGANALVSFGIAGGLAAALTPGTVVLATTVIDNSGNRWETSTPWRNAAATAIPDTAAGTLISTPTPATTPDEKTRLNRDHQALAVDMESAGVARAAAEAKCPFLVVRVIADPADRSLPSSALHGIDAEGRQRPLRVVSKLIVRPWELSGLIRLSNDSRTALRQLGRVAALGHGLLRRPPL